MQSHSCKCLSFCVTDDLKSMELVDMSSLDEQLKLEADDKICKMASDNTLKTFVGEYRKRKQSRSMPASSHKSKLKVSAIKNELDQEINKQQKSSYLKVWLIIFFKLIFS